MAESGSIHSFIHSLIFEWKIEMNAIVYMRYGFLNSYKEKEKNQTMAIRFEINTHLMTKSSYKEFK